MFQTQLENIIVSSNTRKMKRIFWGQLSSKLKLNLCAFAIVLVFIIILLTKKEYLYCDHISFNNHNHSGNINHKYNLMEETTHLDKSSGNYQSSDCTLDYMNGNKLAQDHPCVVETIRMIYLNEPSPQNIPLQLDSNDTKDTSPGQTGVIFRLLKNQTNGFFVECGALDGEYLSNTLDLERKFNWGGVLIEANPKVNFQPKENTGLSHIEGEAETLQKPGVPGVDPDMVRVPCFPFYSVLLAVGRTKVDFFSLDVEGHELKVLQTIPWHKVDIKALTIEWDNMPEGQDVLSRFMEENGFIRIGAFDFKFTRDVIFIKDLINI